MSEFVASDWARLEAVRRAKAILSGDLDILEGCVALAEVADGVVPLWLDDPDFVVFGAVASECDGIPLGAARQQWQGEALARVNATAQEYSARVRAEVLCSCGNIVSRFGDDNVQGESAV